MGKTCSTIRSTSQTCVDSCQGGYKKKRFKYLKDLKTDVEVTTSITRNFDVSIL